MKISEIRTSINSMIQYWRDEGDVASLEELRIDSFIHLRWLLEKMSLADALLRMKTH